jgi:serine/threonine-protein kinase
VERLGRYEIVRHWASGGMAQVLLARTTGLGGFERYVVVKRIHSEHAMDERFVKMFLDEARLAAMLHHGNIVQVHEVGEADGRIFFAMEYVHGEELRRVLRNLNVKKEKMPLDHVVAIISAAADALHHAHEQRSADGKPLGLVHRDITPANIIVGYDGIVKVVDFGIAKAASRSTETAGGTLKGKVGYMSPEQCLGKPVDRRSDVYSLGVVLYETTCVRRLFKNDNDFLTMSSIIAAKVPPASEHRADVPEELEQIMMKALAVRPEDRYQTAAEMSAALEQFAGNAGLRPTPKGLAAFLKQRFGSRPEPWLVEGGEPEPVVTDFDGSEKGLVTAPMQALENLAIPPELSSTSSAPIMQARKKAFAVGSEVITNPGSSSPVGRILAKVTTWFRTTLPAWARRTLPPWAQTRRSKIAVGSGLVLLLALLVFDCGRSSPSRGKPEPQLAVPVTAPVVAPRTVESPVAAGSAQPVTTPAATPATKPVVKSPAAKPAVKATAKPPEKKKRPRPKFVF